MNVKSGDRVGAILESTNSTVIMFGFGTYLGDQACPVGPFGLPRNEWFDLQKKNGFKNPKEFTNPCILLDSGKHVWGFQCWWGPEDKIRELISGKAVTVKEDHEDLKPLSKEEIDGR